MLVFGGNAEVGEKESDDKDVIHREREFDEIAGEEFQRFLASTERPQSQRKKHGQAKPDCRPEQRLAERDDVGTANNDPESNRENDEDENNESRPVPPGDLNHC